jgi:hypothetical protein
MAQNFTVRNVTDKSASVAIKAGMASDDVRAVPITSRPRVQRIELERRDRFGRFGRR